MSSAKLIMTRQGQGLTLVLYRTELAPEYVDDESRTILWDATCKGQVAAFDSLVDGIVIAGIGAGPDNPFDYSTQEALDTIRPFLKDLTDNLRYCSNDDTSMEQGLASGELVAATTQNESVVRLKGEGLPVAFANPKKGATGCLVECTLSSVSGHAQTSISNAALLHKKHQCHVQRADLRRLGSRGET